jgi:DNA-binding GntR family transcriptional regulator
MQAGRLYSDDQTAATQRKLFIKEHNEIFSALAQRDVRAARNAWSNHIRQTKRRIVDF